jgi:hypothetical protein
MNLLRKGFAHRPTHRRRAAFPTTSAPAACGTPTRRAARRGGRAVRVAPASRLAQRHHEQQCAPSRSPLAAARTPALTWHLRRRRRCRGGRARAVVHVRHPARGCSARGACRARGACAPLLCLRRQEGAVGQRWRREQTAGAHVRGAALLAQPAQTASACCACAGAARVPRRRVAAPAHARRWRAGGRVLSGCAAAGAGAKKRCTEHKQCVAGQPRGARQRRRLPRRPARQLRRA